MLRLVWSNPAIALVQHPITIEKEKMFDQDGEMEYRVVTYTDDVHHCMDYTVRYFDVHKRLSN